MSQLIDIERIDILRIKQGAKYMSKKAILEFNTFYVHLYVDAARDVVTLEVACIVPDSRDKDLFEKTTMRFKVTAFSLLSFKQVDQEKILANLGRKLKFKLVSSVSVPIYIYRAIEKEYINSSAGSESFVSYTQEVETENIVTKKLTKKTKFAIMKR